MCAAVSEIRTEIDIIFMVIYSPLGLCLYVVTDDHRCCHIILILYMLIVFVPTCVLVLVVYLLFCISYVTNLALWLLTYLLKGAKTVICLG